jgi:hypothetical protein
VKKYKTELEEDRIVSKHLDTLYNSMLEQNLCRYTIYSLTFLFKVMLGGGRKVFFYVYDL